MKSYMIHKNPSMKAMKITERFIALVTDLPRHDAIEDKMVCTAGRVALAVALAWRHASERHARHDKSVPGGTSRQ